MINPIEHAIYRLVNSPVLNYPYPHFFCKEVFPWDFYDALVASLPDDEAYEPLSGGYANRVAMKGSLDMIEELNSPRFASHILGMFRKPYYERFAYSKNPPFSTDLRFIRDSEGYKIGPHTDAPRKVISLLFYLPKDSSDFEYGTGIYIPKDKVQTCPGGPHHKFEGFDEVWRAPFLPNSCFGFWKTPNSWHAVDKICRKIRRDVMLYNIYTDPESGNEQVRSISAK